MALRLKRERALGLRWVFFDLLKLNALASPRKVGSWVPPLGGTNTQRGTLEIRLVPMPRLSGRLASECGTASSALWHCGGANG